MSSFLQGAAARDTGTDFEKEISKSFQAYAKIGRAYLDFMPLPMSPCGIRHPLTKAPLYIPKGKAPFDVYGHAPVQLTTAPAGALEPGAKIVPVALFVGAELKATSEPETSLPIVKPNKHASGIAYHQLAALALVARMGGIARIVWDNGGQIGVLREEAIMAAHVIYDASLQSEVRGKGKGPNGSRSIKWESFEKVDYANVGGIVCIDWLTIQTHTVP